MKPPKLWKRYLKMAQKAVLLVKEHELQFNVKWLEEASAWIEENEFVTPGQKTAIDNVLPAVKNMVRYRKIIERRKR